MIGVHKMKIRGHEKNSCIKRYSG